MCGLVAVRCSSPARLSISYPRPWRNRSWKLSCTCEHLQMLGKIFSPLGDRLDLLEHVSNTHQVGVKEVFGHAKKAKQGGDSDGVIHIAACFTSNHDAPHSHNRNLLRNVCALTLQDIAGHV